MHGSSVCVIIIHAHLHVTGSPELDCTFTGSELDCELLFNVLSDMNPKLFDHANIIEAALYSDGTKTGFKCLVLLPGRIMCCGRKVTVTKVSLQTVVSCSKILLYLLLKLNFQEPPILSHCVHVCWNTHSSFLQW